jgi:polyisoprenyl-teichoic acid--peptidoglycan teichoic acid transferase
VSLMPKSRGGSLWRFALAAVLVIGFTAATTAVAGLLKVSDIARAIGATPSLPNADVVLPKPGAPETLLLIGSDHRFGTPYRLAETDTMMLVRIDDSSQTINVLSIPRDLRVQLPDGTGKLNAAYSEGGPNLLIKTLKTQVFAGLRVNHIIDINFRGFSDMIDAIGCVYTDVDHRYYNLSQPAPSADNYSSIDIEPGYQKLCGHNQADSGALAFVRFRHTDTDIVRNARQQDFLRWAKDGYSADQLVSQEGTLTKIFGENAQTDHSLHTTDGLLDLFGLIVNADKLSVKQIPFPAILSNCPAGSVAACYVNAEAPAMASAYREFITPTIATAKTSSPTTHHRHKLSTAGLVADPSDARNQALDLGKLGLPIYYPKLMVANTDVWAPAYCSSLTGNCNNGFEPATEYEHSYPRAYVIHGQHGGVYPSYRMTVVLNSGLGEYYGIQGTTWLHPPILNNASGTQTVNGKQLMIYKNGAKISLVAWRTAAGSYWISNSLNDAIGNNQMIEIAGSLTRAP